jgi:electron transfer flavoprotein alpha subunit
VNILVVAEHLRGQVQEITRELITAAVSLGGSVTLALIDDSPEDMIDQVRLAGVHRVITI